MKWKWKNKCALAGSAILFSMMCLLMLATAGQFQSPELQTAVSNSPSDAEKPLLRAFTQNKAAILSAVDFQWCAKGSRPYPKSSAAPASAVAVPAALAIGRVDSPRMLDNGFTSLVVAATQPRAPPYFA